MDACLSWYVSHLALCRQASPLLNSRLFAIDLVSIKAESLIISLAVSYSSNQTIWVHSGEIVQATRSLKRLSAVAAGQVRRQQREEAAAQQQGGPDVLRQPGAGEAPGQRLAAFLGAAPAAPAARLEHGADRPLPVQPADLHDRRQPPVCRVRGQRRRSVDSTVVV